MMRAVICAVNSKYVHSSLAAWYLLAGVEEYSRTRICARVVEATINDDPDAVAARIVENSPSVIGLGCYIWNITFVKKLLPLIKKALPDAVVVLGGPEVSYNAGEILRDEPLADYVLSGEGEKPLALLLDAVASGADVSGIPGVCFRRSGEIVVSPPYCAAEEPPDPYTGAYFDALNGRIAYLETSRGCPFSCAFCLSGRQGRVRYFDSGRAGRDIVRLANSGARTVKLVDRTFNADPRRARAIFGFILDKYGTEIPEGVRFHFEIAGDLLDEETLALLGAAPRGLFQFEIGLQSFGEETLLAVSRKTDTARLKENISRLMAFGNIHIHLDLIAGLPFEDMARFGQSFNTAFSLEPHMLQLGFLKLLHGAAMREEPEAFPAEDLRRLHLAEDALERLYNSGRFRRTLRYVLERTSKTPFELFLDTGAALSENAPAGEPLDDYTARLFRYFGALEGVDKAALLDAMICDRLASNAAGGLPPVLQIRDGRLKAAMRAVNGSPATRLQKGVRRGFALLASENAVVWADDMERDPVTGAYTLHKTSLDELNLPRPPKIRYRGSAPYAPHD